MLHTSLKDSEPGAMATPLCAFSVNLSSLWNVSRSLATFWNLPSCKSERGEAYSALEVLEHGCAVFAENEIFDYFCESAGQVGLVLETAHLLFKR